MFIWGQRTWQNKFYLCMDVKVETVSSGLDVQAWGSGGKVWTRDQDLGAHQLGSISPVYATCSCPDLALSCI